MSTFAEKVVDFDITIEHDIEKFDLEEKKRGKEHVFTMEESMTRISKFF